MATYTIDKIKYGSDTFKLQDNVSGYITSSDIPASFNQVLADNGNSYTPDDSTDIAIYGSSGIITTIQTYGSVLVGHSNSITAGTAGTSSATSGSTLAVPYVTYDAQGHITASGTHTHTITGFSTTDTKQNITLGTTSKAFITGVTTTPTSSAQALTGIADTGVYLTTTAGQINATTYKVNEKVTLQWNSTDLSLDFIFV